jgi:PhzF family phenazine biosynthesis protein
MILKVFLVDALMDGPFSGAPTTVLYLSEPMERFKMASLAAEFGTTESVFALPHGDAFLLRFFTPQAEIKIGAHSSQAAAHIIYEMGICPPTEKVTLLTQEGEALARHFDPDVTSIELDEEPMTPLGTEEIGEMAPLLGLEPKEVEWGAMTSGKKAILALHDYSEI